MVKIEFENTTNFIIELAVKRIKSKQSELGKSTIYQIVGYDNLGDFERAAVPFELSNLYKFLEQDFSGKAINLSENYYKPLVDSLKFSDIHELLWGTDEEVAVNCREIYNKFVSDGLYTHSEKIKKFFQMAKKNLPIKLKGSLEERIYDEIEMQFVKAFADFTKATKTVMPIVGAAKKKYTPQRNPKYFVGASPDKNNGTKIGEYLGFKKLNKALSKFVEDNICSILLSLEIEKLMKE